MERLVTSPETSKKLEAAGFPIDPALAWFELDSDALPAYVAPYTGDEGQQPAYSAQEIADQLPIGSMVAIDEQRRYVTTHVNDLLDEDTQMAATMAEALAAYWLKLKKEVVETGRK
jgi:hypothetical protein